MAVVGPVVHMDLLIAIRPLSEIVAAVAKRNSRAGKAILVELNCRHIRSGMTGGHGHCVAGYLQSFGASLASWGDPLTAW